MIEYPILGFAKGVGAAVFFLGCTRLYPRSSNPGSVFIETTSTS